MQLYNILSTIKELALSSPLVNTYVSDIDTVSSYHDLRYGVVSISSGVSTMSTDGFLEWSGSIYYINRLVDKNQDSSVLRDNDNAQLIQSQGLDVLHTIVKNLPNDFGVVSESYSYFTHKFLDLCAGTRLDITIRVPYNLCFDVI